jgi:heme oxygenase
MTALSQLRAATGGLHQEVERRLDLVRQLSSMARRRRIVERFYGLHAGAELALWPRLVRLDGLDLEQRRRTTWLRRDLTSLGSNTDGLPLCAVAPPASAEEALGFLYVLEGSTLGGKIVRRAVEGQGAEMTGLRFLSPYGAATGERWRALVEVIEAVGAAAPGAIDGLVMGGVRGFETTRDWLCAEVPA